MNLIDYVWNGIMVLMYHKSISHAGLFLESRGTLSINQKQINFVFASVRGHPDMHNAMLTQPTLSPLFCMVLCNNNKKES